MTRRTLTHRLFARARDERGFTIVETVVAMVVIFGSLTALAYTATIGFRYISYGRDRQQATALSNQIMEEIRGQAYSVITRGMSSSDLSGDARIVTCSTIKRFESCAGPELVHSSVGAETAPWIIPHSGSTTTGNLDVDWATYITNDDPTSSPYSVTVFVTWDGGAIANAPNNVVRLQSDFWSPSGCLSTDTHPFAAPCQPFFYALAEVPSGSISMSGEIYGDTLNFDQATLTMPALRASVQQEQVTVADAAAIETEASFTDPSGISEWAGQVAEADADTDPATSLGLAAGATLAGSGASAQRLLENIDGSKAIGLRLDVGAGQTGLASGSTAASVVDADPCPPSGTAETDSLACAGADVEQLNPVTATVRSDLAAQIGEARVVRITAPGTPSTAVAERDAVAGKDGLVEVQASRVLPNLFLGGFPTSGMTPLTGMSSTDTDPSNYCMRVTGYEDTAHALAGDSTATTPTADVTAGTFTYYDSTTNAYSSIGVESAALETLSFTCSKSQTVGTDVVEWTVSVQAGGISPANVPAPVLEVDPLDAQIKLGTEASVQPIHITFDYQITVNGLTEVDLEVVADPGILLASGVYGPPPESS